MATSTNQESMSVLTTDGKFMVIALVNIMEGTILGLYPYQGTIYYTWPDSQGAPSQSYAGMIHAAGQYFVPIAATIHTHNACQADGTDGITGQTLSTADQNLASTLTVINNWIIGCGAIASYSNASTSPVLVSSAPLSTSCSLIH